MYNMYNENNNGKSIPNLKTEKIKPTHTYM